MSQRRRSAAAIVAVGTELTSGQLVNSNATWIAGRLEDLGLEVINHTVVPDDADLMLEAFENAGRRAQYVFISGGLGPTKDDFTREVVARWLGLELEFDRASLQRIQERFKAMGRPFHAFQRQQCDFPQGAQIITNLAGTANAFYCRGKDLDVWTLPGPPREIESVWQSFIGTQLESLIQVKKSLHLRSWLCFGEGESAVAHRVESVLENSPFQTGYRAHAPYVEVKVWGREQDFKQYEELLCLDRALGSWVISRQRKTWAHQLLDVLAGDRALLIDDGVTRGRFHQDVVRILKEHRIDKNLQLCTQFSQEIPQEVSQGTLQGTLPPRASRSQALRTRDSRAVSDLYLSVQRGAREGDFELALRLPEGEFTETLSFPSPGVRGAVFQGLWAMERACARMLERLSS